VIADFNGLLEPGLLCLSHGDTCRNEAGEVITLRSGLIVTAFDHDADDNGQRDDLFATGTVEPSPEYARCRGSRWSLRIDHNGIRHESDLKLAGLGPHPSK